MRLGQFFSTIAPFLEGRIGHAEAAAALYLDEPGLARDRERLAIYGRFCAGHRLATLGSVFSEARAAIVGAQGEQGWEQLVADYFAAHPMAHAELNANGAAFPSFLAEQAAARGLAPWLPELADLEWWSFRTRTAPDEHADAEPDAGPLRLGATVELRPYAHDLLGWLEERAASEPVEVERAADEAGNAQHDLAPALEDAAGAARSDSPPARPCVVLFWRDRDLDSRYGEAEPSELLVLRAVYEGLSLSAAASLSGATESDLLETQRDLRAAGVLLGVA